MLSDLHTIDTMEMIDLLFVAANTVETDILFDDEKILDNYNWESGWIDNFYNLTKLLKFLFQTDIPLTAIAHKENKQIFDLTSYKHTCITQNDLDNNYQDWILISGRDNTMDEYGSLTCIIGYVQHNIEKNNLLLITEKRPILSR